MILRRRRSQPKPELSAEAIRREYAELLRHFFAGRMTNVEYERRYDALVRGGSTPDEVWDIYDAAWHLYCDIRTHTMAGDRRPSPCLRRRIARWIAFLYSDAPYNPRSTEFPRSVWTPPVGGIDLLLCMTLAAGWLAGLLLPVLGYVSAGFAVTLCFIAAFAALHVLHWISGWGVSINPGVARRAYSEDESDPWPFSTVAAMQSAIAYPRLLAGRRRVEAEYAP